MTTSPAPPSAEDQLAVERLLLEYARCLDEDRLDEWPEFFVADGLYKVLSRENEVRGLPAPIIYYYSRGMMQDRVTALRDALTFEPVYTRHFVSNVYVQAADAAGFDVSSNYAVYQTTEEGRTDLFSIGRCVDRIVRDGGGLRFRSRIVIADTFAVKNNLALPI